MFRYCLVVNGTMLDILIGISNLQSYTSLSVVAMLSGNEMLSRPLPDRPSALVLDIDRHWYLRPDNKDFLRFLLKRLEVIIEKQIRKDHLELV